MEAVKERFRVCVTKWMAYRAKWWAHKKLHGNMKEHYAKLGPYLGALKASNPNSHMEIVTDPKVQSSPPVFHRMFICFEGLCKGLLAGCRKVLCLDGCFLKTFLSGMLLTAIGRDGNDQMFPLAWTVVEGENNDSWIWFMERLRACLNSGEGEEWTLISDQQKGLVNAVAHVFPKAEHRNCARHIFANWHKIHKGDELKGLFWKACRAYSVPEFEEAMLEMKEISPAAAQAFMHQNPKSFCKCFVKTNNKCDVIVSNMAETFNGYIIHARAKHIIYMLEDIRVALMSRLVLKKQKMASYESDICPRIQIKLEEEKVKAVGCEVFPSAYMVFQVRDRDDVAVNLQEGTCTCRKWDLSGIPCHHAIACANFVKQNAELYVHDCYKKSTYMKAYEFSIPPCPGERHWPKVDFPLDPPPIKIGPGRPRKNRRKDPFEDPKKSGKLTRHGMEMTWNKCLSKGHNRRKCNNPERAAPEGEPPPKRGRGRPRKLPSSGGGRGAAPDTSHHERTAEPDRRTNGRRGKGRGRGGGRFNSPRVNVDVRAPQNTAAAFEHPRHLSQASTYIGQSSQSSVTNLNLP